MYTSNLRVHRISILSKSNGAQRIPGPPEIDTPSTSAVLTSKQSMEGVAPKLDKEKNHRPNEKYASFQKKMSYTWQPLGPLLKVKLLVGDMYTCSNLKSQKHQILKHHHRNITINIQLIYTICTGKDGKSVTFSELIFWSMFQFTPWLGSSLGTSCQELFNSFSLVSSRAFGVFV